MDIVNTVYREFHSLGTSLGFGAFEGGVIYLSVFSIIIFKSIDAVKDVLDNKKKKEIEMKKQEGLKRQDKSTKKEEEDLVFKLKIIK